MILGLKCFLHFLPIKYSIELIFIISDKIDNLKKKKKKKHMEENNKPVSCNICKNNTLFPTIIRERGNHDWEHWKALNLCLNPRIYS